MTPVLREIVKTFRLPERKGELPPFWEGSAPFFLLVSVGLLYAGWGWPGILYSLLIPLGVLAFTPLVGLILAYWQFTKAPPVWFRVMSMVSVPLVALTVYLLFHH